MTTAFISDMTCCWRAFSMWFFWALKPFIVSLLFCTEECKNQQKQQFKYLNSHTLVFLRYLISSLPLHLPSTPHWLFGRSLRLCAIDYKYPFRGSLSMSENTTGGIFTAKNCFTAVPKLHSVTTNLPPLKDHGLLFFAISLVYVVWESLLLYLETAFQI